MLANSQGASLAISYLLQHHIENPELPPPFRFAVLFTPGIVVSPDRTYKTKEIRSFLEKLDKHDIDKIIRGLLDVNGRAMIEPEKFTGLGNLSPAEKELCLTLVCDRSRSNAHFPPPPYLPLRRLTSKQVQHTETLLHTRRNFKVAETNSFPDYSASVDAKDKFPRFFHPIYTEVKVSIPTVHVLGAEENPAVKRLAEVSKQLCAREKIIEVRHKGAHEIPNKREGVDAVVRAIERADFMGRGW